MLPMPAARIDPESLPFGIPLLAPMETLDISFGSLFEQGSFSPLGRGSDLVRLCQEILTGRIETGSLAMLDAALDVPPDTRPEMPNAAFLHIQPVPGGALVMDPDHRCVLLEDRPAGLRLLPWMFRVSFEARPMRLPDAPARSAAFDVHVASWAGRPRGGRMHRADLVGRSMRLNGRRETLGQVRHATSPRRARCREHLLAVEAQLSREAAAWIVSLSDALGGRDGHAADTPLRCILSIREQERLPGPILHSTALSEVASWLHAGLVPDFPGLSGETLYLHARARRFDQIQGRARVHPADVRLLVGGASVTLEALDPDTATPLMDTIATLPGLFTLSDRQVGRSAALSGHARLHAEEAFARIFPRRRALIAALTSPVAA